MDYGADTIGFATCGGAPGSAVKSTITVWNLPQQSCSYALAIIIENMFLEMLAAEIAYEFLLLISPLRIYGATGSWVNPIAIT